MQLINQYYHLRGILSIELLTSAWGRLSHSLVLIDLHCRGSVEFTFGEQLDYCKTV